MTIWKFPLEVANEQRVAMPLGAKLLAVQAQHDTPCLWAAVDEKARRVYRTFRVVGTGHPVPDYDDLEYLGTVQVAGGDLVWHVFEVVR